MGRIRPMQRIYDIVRDIENDQYRLPSIQRSFVWDEQRIAKLMDSVMSDYPIGSFLVWRPELKIPIRTRRFVFCHEPGDRYVSDEETETPPYLVLDGQQRLQSFVLAFSGTYEGRRMYFDVASDQNNEQDNARYEFRFLSKVTDGNGHYWVRPSELIKLGVPNLNTWVRTQFPNAPEAVQERIIQNVAQFIQVFNMGEGVSVLEVKPELPYNDVLEVFVRVNSGGIVLSKSDLIFATVVLFSPEMEEKFIALVDEINSGEDYDFNTDFIIRTSLVVTGNGAKYDVSKIADSNYIADLEAEFNRLQRALLSLIEFLKSDAKIQNKRFLKSDLALIPIVEFIHRQQHQQIPDGQRNRLRQYLYMSYFMRFYSYGPEGKLNRLSTLLRESPDSRIFPVEEIGKYMEERTGIAYAFQDAMFKDLDLILNIIEDGVYQIPKRRGWSLEKDHIFPKSVLARSGFERGLINDVGNFRFVNKTRNLKKLASMPEGDLEFFGQDEAQLRRLFLETRRDPSENNFRAFVEKRKELIRTQVREFLRL